MEGRQVPPFFIMDAVKEIAADLLGISGRKVKIGGKGYTIPPPTIERLVGAGHSLSEIGNILNLSDFITAIPHLEEVCHALSWFIAGDESLFEELKKGTPAEVVGAFLDAISMLDIKDFMRLSVSVRNVRMLVADTR